MKEIRFSRQAIKSLNKIPSNDSNRIKHKIKQYAINPQSQANNIKKMTGFASLYRLRVGNYRVIFTEDNVIISIERIAPRGSAYK